MSRQIRSRHHHTQRGWYCSHIRRPRNEIRTILVLQVKISPDYDHTKEHYLKIAKHHGLINHCFVYLPPLLTKITNTCLHTPRRDHHEKDYCGSRSYTSMTPQTMPLMIMSRSSLYFSLDQLARSSNILDAGISGPSRAAVPGTIWLISLGEERILCQYDSIWHAEG